MCASATIRLGHTDAGLVCLDAAPAEPMRMLDSLSRLGQIMSELLHHSSALNCPVGMACEFDECLQIIDARVRLANA
jgi:hypothetical protein